MKWEKFTKKKLKLINKNTNIQTLAGKPVEVPIREATHQYLQSKGAPLMKNNWQLILIKQQKEKENRKQQAKLAMAMR